jgi:Fe-S cluster biosynthesis and repair protein YggX
MEFKKYQHIERFGTDEVQGIELGECYIFPKIDGTNSSVYLRDGELCAASRNRELTLDDDNAGFYASIKDNPNIKAFLGEYSTLRLFGEWLVPHSLKTYRDDAWRRFYVFDVCEDDGEGFRYLPFTEYEPLLKEYGIDYIPPIQIIKNGDYDKFIACIEKNGFLIKDGQGAGEGIVIKNYGFYNKYKRQTWAKIVTNEFKEKHHKEMGAPVMENRLVEESIADEFITPSLVEKEYAKIVTEQDGWTSKYIPMLLGRVFYALVAEETWNILKKFNTPTINFKTLNSLAIRKIKTVKPELF